MRRVVITGATRGLGLALAQHFLEAGDEVTGCGRTASVLTHPRYTHCCVDVTSAEEVDLFFEGLHARLGRIDVLINNAGVAAMNALVLMPLETARRIVDTNLLGTFSFTRAAVRLMRDSGQGRIVNFTSVAVPLRLEGELGPLGITCNAIGPSPIKTGMLAGVPERKLQALIQAQAVRRWAEPADVVNVVEFFLRPESGMVTGQVVYLGGAA
jgi:3-oxoacyl-[acyl-carrier protein] reductase